MDDPPPHKELSRGECQPAPARFTLDRRIEADLSSTGIRSVVTPDPERSRKRRLRRSGADTVMQFNLGVQRDASLQLGWVYRTSHQHRATSDHPPGARTGAAGTASDPATTRHGAASTHVSHVTDMAIKYLVVWNWPGFDTAPVRACGMLRRIGERRIAPAYENYAASRRPEPWMRGPWSSARIARPSGRPRSRAMPWVPLPRFATRCSRGPCPVIYR